jgi:hypothetical protein
LREKINTFGRNQEPSMGHPVLLSPDSLPTWESKHVFKGSMLIVLHSASK